MKIWWRVRMKKSERISLCSAAASVIMISALFFIIMIAGSLRFQQPSSRIFMESYEMLGSFDVYLNEKLIAQNVTGHFTGEETGRFSDEYVLKTELGNISGNYNDPTLCFRSYSSAVEVYQDGKRIFSLADRNPVGESASFSGGRYNFASLDENYSGSVIEIIYSTRYTQNGPFEIYPVYIGNKTSLIVNEAASNFPSLCSGLSILLAAFIISLLCLTIDNRKSRKSLWSTANLLLTTGIWIVLQNRSKQFIMPNVTAAIDLSMLAMAVLPLVICNYIRKNYNCTAFSMKGFEIFSYAFLAIYTAVYTGYAFFNIPTDSSLPFITIMLGAYFISLIAYFAGKYVKTRFEGGLFLISGLCLYLLSIMLENSVLDSGSSVNEQLFLYVPMYTALLLFLFKTLRDGIRISTGRKDRKKALRMAYTDALTGVLNRKALANRIEHMQQSAIQRFCIFIFDIDGMKECNDTFGHLTGDKVLIAFAKSLKDASKELNKYIFRYGGDEFLLMVQEEEGFSPSELISEVRKYFREYLPVKKYDFSVGWSRSAGNAKTDMISILREADNRMYYDKIQNRKETESTSTPPICKT